MSHSTGYLLFTARSPRGSLGVFAGERIPTGKYILTFLDSGPMLTRGRAKKRSIEEFCLQAGIGKYILVRANPHRNINHSCRPNTGIRKNVDLWSIRGIEKGEELTFDYSTTMNEDDMEMVCHCGEECCRGLILDFKYLDPELQAHYDELGIVGDFCRISSPTDCSGCRGACCSLNRPGGVLETPFVTRRDMDRIAAFTGIGPERFMLRGSGGEPWISSSSSGRFGQLKTKDKGYGCIFFDERTCRCSIYEARPVDCRLFPLDVIRLHGEYHLTVHEEMCSIIPSLLKQYVEYALNHLIPQLAPWMDAYSRTGKNVNPESMKRLARIDTVCHQH